ncbi:HEAT repeat domain-containing protein [Streptomyces cyaneofuscatus]
MTEGMEDMEGSGREGAERMVRFAAEVDWSKVTNPYYPERYGPALLERLWSPDWAGADDARMELYYACCADGSSVLPAAAEVLPILVEAARDPVVTVRTGVLELITDIARAGNSALTAEPETGPGDEWRPTIALGWAAAWEQAVDPLLPLLADDDGDVRAGAAAALAQAAGRADDVIDRFLARFEDEPWPEPAEQLVLGVGELARHAGIRREAAIVWLRQRMNGEGKGEEPDFDSDLDGWTAWTDRVEHDVRLSAIVALRRVLPGHADPAYVRTTADVLLGSSFLNRDADADDRSWKRGLITDADAQLDDDLPGRITLVRGLLRHDGALRREGGLWVAAVLMARWRSAVPELLPDVAEFVDDPHPGIRAFALRVLAMCGGAAQPWADRVAAHLTEETEPHRPARNHAVWALSRMGDERCVAPLAGLLASRDTGFAAQPPLYSTCDWKESDLNFREALAPFAGCTEVLLGPLLARIRDAGPTDRGSYRWIIGQWHRDGAPVVEQLAELLDADESLIEAAHALRGLGAGPIAAVHRDRLRERLGPPAFWEDPARIDPFVHRSLTGDDEPVLALLRSPEKSGFPELSAKATESDRVRACTVLGPLAADAAGQLRGMFREALREKPTHPSVAPKGAVERARALWRVTGHAEEVLSVLLELTERSAQRGILTPGGVEPLLLLAEIAAAQPPVVDQVAQRLHATAKARIEGSCRSEALRLLQALWELTSDPRQLAPALVELVRICPSDGGPPTKVEALELLAEVVAADPACAAEAAREVRGLLDVDERPVEHGQWRAVVQDEALCAAVRAIAVAAEAGAGAKEEGSLGP